MSQFHRWSELFIPTLREAPADAETASHKLLLRSGYVRQSAPGVHSYLFLGQRCLNKITNIVREEMSRLGQEFHLPASNEKDTWEILLDIAGKDLRSYKQLPQIWYQIATRLFDDSRANPGLLRARQAMLANSCSFDLDAGRLDISYQKHFQAFGRILDRCGLTYLTVTAGREGDRVDSQAFVALSNAGNDPIIHCPHCNYAATADSAASAIDPVDDLAAEGDGAPLLVHTPGVKTIDELARYLNVSPKHNMKTLAYVAEETESRSSGAKKRPVVAFVRGDHQLNEAKLSKAIGGARFRPMEAEEIIGLFGSPAGSLGPIGLTIAYIDAGRFGPGTVVLVDKALQGRRHLIAGANKQDFHLKNITPGKDFQPTAYADLRTINAGETCPDCGQNLTVDTAIQIAKLSKLDSRSRKISGARVLDQNGKEVSPAMGWYSIGVERILIAAVEQNHDNDGFWLPAQIAPFEVIVTPISARDDKAMAAAADIAHTLTAMKLDVILDDRDERPGVKFKDADLAGIPYRINVGKKVTEGTVEVVNRSTRQIRDASITAIAEYCSKPRPGR